MAAVRVEFTAPELQIRYAIYRDADTGEPVGAVECDQATGLVRISVLDGLRKGVPTPAYEMSLGASLLRLMLRNRGYDTIVD